LIQILPWGTGSDTIQGFVQSDNILFNTTFNRPISNLYDNDSSIVSQIYGNLVTNKVYASSISPETLGTVTTIDTPILEFASSIEVKGAFVITEKIEISDNIILLNSSNALPLNGISGFSVNRSNGNASVVFDNATKYWNIDKDFQVNTLRVDLLTADTVNASYLEFSYPTLINNPDATYNRFFYKNGDLQYKLSNGDSYVIDTTGFYDVYAETQSEFESALSNANRIYLKNGSYTLNSDYYLKNGFMLHGQSEDSCIITGTNGSFFVASEVITDIECKGFTFDCNNESRIEAYTFNASNVGNSFFNINIKNVADPAVYYKNNIGDIFYGVSSSVSSIAYQNLDYAEICGISSNIGEMFDNCSNVKLKTIIENDQYFGVGNFSL